MLAVGVPSSFFRTRVPATAVYLSVSPFTVMVCSVLEVLSSILGGAGAAAPSAGGAPPRLPPLCAPIGSASAVKIPRMAKFLICFDCTLDRAAVRRGLLYYWAAQAHAGRLLYYWAAQPQGGGIYTKGSHD